MKIAFDLRGINKPGIGRYMKSLAEGTIARAPEHEYLLLMPENAVDRIDVPFLSNVQKIAPPLKYYSFREQLEIPRILRREKVDLLHSPHFNLPLMRACPAVVTIHDVIYLVFPEELPSRIGRMYYRAMISASVRLADSIITVSEFSKKEIVRLLHVDAARIQVIPSGIARTFQKVTDLRRLESMRKRYGIERDYILYTGIYRRRKNHAGLLHAFREFVRQGHRAQLVVAGPLGEGENDLRRLAAELEIGNDTVIAGFVSEPDLLALYSEARVYACPSLYEGFGFTVLEAMACGVPVVCSAEASLPEVAGEGALYANPRIPEEFADALARAFSNDTLRAELIQRGSRNLGRFSWNAVVDETLAIYHSVLDVPGSQEGCV
ncbi:MAG: glycosyltransferase family 4 protein [Candidatus Angelobacter sp.]